MPDWGGGLKGAATGAGIGAAFGPVGAGVGAGLGGLYGLFGGGQSSGQANDALRGKFDPNRNQADMNALQQLLMDRATGKNSMVGAQHQQALGRSLAQQQALAAGARPGMQGLATRTMMQNQSQIAGRAHEAALQARAAEQQQAEGALAQYLLALRNQEIQGALGASGKPTGQDELMGGLASLGGTLASMRGG